MAQSPTVFHRLPGVVPPVDQSSERARGAGPTAAPPRVGVIRNPRSHRNKGSGNLAAETAGVLQATPTTKVELEAAIGHFADAGIDVLIIDGGDGTVRDVLTRAAPVFAGKWPGIVVVPKGKTNALAVDLGLPKHWSLTHALEAARNGKGVKRRPMVLERLDTPGRARLGFILGAGVFNAGIEVGQVAHRFGAFQSFAVAVTAAFGAAQALIGFGKSPWRRIAPMRIYAGPDRREIVHSGHGTPRGRFLAAITTLTRFPLGLRPFTATADDPALNFLIFDAPVRRAVASLAPIMLGYQFDYLTRLGVQRGAAEEMVLELDNSFILDGEKFPPGTYRVSLGPELHFIVP